MSEAGPDSVDSNAGDGSSETDIDASRLTGVGGSIGAEFSFDEFSSSFTIIKIVILYR